ncbi:hypothetical protein K504DRAFT_489226 [Pleomassaria siparia CBS 279.74]|uniref:non-specific serine/threonine protein kinase n=1 Tax=Pleomassaria siparia CBS 279.74 TaxID=1314801 RepID=A0A6G1KFS1_9PLEO|nr:hypothetical protein K504DRAFT_489226 [Pleomassaria siparia CBS 279.74]
MGSSKDTLLSLDMGTKDSFYRIRRDYADDSSVVYVHLQDLDIPCEDSRTYGPSVIHDLSLLIDVWDRFADPSDYVQCRGALEELHSFGCVHGDLNKFNIIITTNGPRFIDYERTRLDTDLSDTELATLQQQEIDGLDEVLNNEEGWGKPWPETGS